MSYRSAASRFGEQVAVSMVVEKRGDAAERRYASPIAGSKKGAVWRPFFGDSRVGTAFASDRP
jgi:hypothetical protein